MAGGLGVLQLRHEGVDGGVGAGITPASVALIDERAEISQDGVGMPLRPLILQLLLALAHGLVDRGGGLVADLLHLVEESHVASFAVDPGGAYPSPPDSFPEPTVGHRRRHGYRRGIEPTNEPPEYLSPAWFVAADDLLRGDDGLRDRSRGVHLVLQQTVTDDDGSTTWHVVFADGEVSLQTGPAERADVAFTCDRATAEAVRNGHEDAATAFLSGRLRMEGTVTALLGHSSLFGELDDVLAPLR